MKRSLLVALRLAKEGFMGGNPDAILKAPTATVIAMMEYTNYVGEYQETYMELNKEGSK